MSVESVRKIFDVVWAKRLPNCYVEWILRVLQQGYWRLEVYPFLNEPCKIIKNDNLPHVIFFKCGFFQSRYGGSGFRNRHIKHGYHRNLHEAIHCLNKYRKIPFKDMMVEERIREYIIDLCAKVGDKYIIVELGELSDDDKFWLIYDENVKEFWFDSKSFFYCLSAKKPLPKKEHLFRFMYDYYERTCKENLNKIDECLTYGSRNCLEAIRIIEKEKREVKNGSIITTHGREPEKLSIP